MSKEPFAERPFAERIAGKVIVIAGGAGGTGEAISRRLAAEGATVLIGDIDIDRAERVAAGIAGEGGTASAFGFDNKNLESIAALVDHGAVTYGRLDGIHIVAGNPAAMASDHDLLTTSFDTWRSQMDSHLYGYAQAMRTAIPIMLRTGGGSIVSTSSAASRGAGTTMIGYQTAKAALETLTRHVARTYGKDGIRCNTIAYGPIQTENMMKNLSDDFRRNALMRIWSPRLGHTTDIAAMAALLHSTEGEWINGQIIDLNGGQLLAP